MASVLADVASHQDDADAIIQRAVYGEFKGETWRRLADFTDVVSTHDTTALAAPDRRIPPAPLTTRVPFFCSVAQSGNRQCGSDNYEAAANMAVELLQKEGFDNVHMEPMTAPRWHRGEESLTLLSPRQYPYKMNMLSLGSSMGTGPDGITAEVVVVRNETQLAQWAVQGRVAGKIVLFNWYCDWARQGNGCYGQGSGLRGRGAGVASRYGAVAALIRSVTGFSMNTPHTGSSSPANISWAAITIEDADMLQRLQDRGLTLTVKLVTSGTGTSLSATTNHNVIADITGSDYPNEVVLISGHFDSWDVGNGVMDDAAGAWIGWSALTLMKALGLKPKRTVRLVLWACEETGGLGGIQYHADHKADSDKYSIVMESDSGVFYPWGMEFSGSANARAIMQSIGVLTKAINTTGITGGGGGLDVQPWISESNVPGGSIWTQNNRYFNYHHTGADNMAVLDPQHLDMAAALWTVYTWVLADTDSMLPRAAPGEETDPHDAARVERLVDALRK